MSKSDGKPNWVEIWTLIVVGVGCVIGIWRTFAVESQVAEVQKELGILEIEEAQQPIIQIGGTIYHSRWGTNENPLRRITLALNLVNEGRAPIEVRTLELRVHRGILDEKWASRLKEAAPKPSAKTYENQFDGFPPPDSNEESLIETDHQAIEYAIVYAIDSPLTKWVEMQDQRRMYSIDDQADGYLYRDQVRPINLDFLIAEGTEPELLKFEVLVKSSDKKLEAISWIGWTSTGPFPSGPFDESIARYVTYTSYNPSFPMTRTWQRGPEFRLKAVQ